MPCSAVITEQGGIWYFCVQVETPSPQRVERTYENTVGCDWGVENAMTLDDGRLFETVQPGRTRAAAVRRAQRAVARCKRGSKSRRKRVLALGRLRRAEANARTTRLHKIAAAIVATTPYVAVEALQVRNMTASAAGTIEAPGKSVAQKSGLNRSILDGAPARLISFIRYKAECAGGEMRAGNARGTSIECAVCGARVPKALSTRVHRCDCGFCVHRDFNSACNIRYRVFGEMSPAILRFREHEIEAGVGLGGHNHRNGGDAPGNISLAIEANQPEILN
jgi:putative transposase